MGPVSKQIIPLSLVPRHDESSSETPTILVVDDERIVADTLSAILRQSGFRVRTAYNAMSALMVAQETLPDLLITDVAMPDKNGVQLAVELLKFHPACKVLLFSGHADSNDLLAAQEAGHNFRLLAKPLHPTEMLHQIAVTLKLPEPKVEKIHQSNVVAISSYA